MIWRRSGEIIIEEERMRGAYKGKTLKEIWPKNNVLCQSHSVHMWIYLPLSQSDAPHERQ